MVQKTGGVNWAASAESAAAYEGNGEVERELLPGEDGVVIAPARAPRGKTLSGRSLLADDADKPRKPSARRL